MNVHTGYKNVTLPSVRNIGHKRHLVLVHRVSGVPANPYLIIVATVAAIALNPYHFRSCQRLSRLPALHDGNQTPCAATIAAKLPKPCSIRMSPSAVGRTAAAITAA